MMKVVAFDIEATGLLLDATTIHCGVTHDMNTGERREFTDEKNLYEYLLSFDRLVAHNGRMYDCPVLERLVGVPAGLPPLPPCLDTLLISRLLWPDKGNTPAGGHSLEKWGQYAGIKKAHAGIEDWSVYTPEMLERCHTDVDIQVWLYKYMLGRIGGCGESLQLEHDVATIITKQIQNGFGIDMEKVRNLEHVLIEEKLGLTDQLSSIPPWVEEKELKTPAYWSLPQTGFTGGPPHPLQTTYETKSACLAKYRNQLTRGPNKIKRTEIIFNPNSRDHVARLFMEKYGWKPKKYTSTDKPQVDETVLASLDYPEAQVISRIMLIDKRLSQIVQWKKYERDGRIHGDVITNGAVSGRMTHSKPNMAQVPASHSPWGADCRACFVPREGWTLVGADASGLELRMLAHYLSKWDNGEYADVVVNGDVHTANQKAAGLPTRDNAKTFIYGWLYGAGDAKIGQIVGQGASAGKRLKSQFLTALPALKKLMSYVAGKETLTGLDGRTYPIRSDHMALNTLLQGAGAILMKKALVILYEALVAKYGPHGDLWAFCGNIHDEWQIECEKRIAKGVGELAVWALGEAGRQLNLGVPIDGEYKIGSDWAETH